MKIHMQVRQTLSLSLLFLLISCASGVSQKSTSKNPTIKEDLSQFRPTYKKDTVKNNTAAVANPATEVINANLAVTEELNKKLSAIATNAPKVAKGYRILLYSGNSREEANLMKQKAEAITSDKVYIEYKAPNFRVKAGDSINRLEVNYLKGKLNSEFPNGVIVPDEVNINY